VYVGESGGNGRFEEEERRVRESECVCECELTSSHPSEADCVSICSSVLFRVDTEGTSSFSSGFADDEGDEDKSHSRRHFRIC
jgi:hypothetical protein